MWPFRREASDDIPIYAVDNTLAPGTIVRGDVRGPGGFRIDGTVEGSVDVEGPVVIGESGAVEGVVRGTDVVVLGRVRGDVHASGHIELGPKGKILGDVTGDSFRVRKGGVLRGTTRMPATDVATTTNPFGFLPLAPETKEPRGGRTLPPPAGAVPPPAELTAPASAPPVASEERLHSSVEVVAGHASKSATG
jgi:cytoskeletal protein CcmA (bactofilin family)